MPWVNSRLNGSRRSFGTLAQIGQRLGEEPGVHQVEDGVLDPPMYWSTGSQRATASGVERERRR